MDNETYQLWNELDQLGGGDVTIRNLELNAIIYKHLPDDYQTIWNSSNYNNDNHTIQIRNITLPRNHPAIESITTYPVSDSFVFDSNIEANEKSTLYFSQEIVDWLLKGYNRCIIGSGMRNSNKTYYFFGELGTPEDISLPLDFTSMPTCLVTCILKLLYERVNESTTSTIVSLSAWTLEDNQIVDLIAPISSKTIDPLDFMAVECPDLSSAIAIIHQIRKHLQRLQSKLTFEESNQKHFFMRILIHQLNNNNSNTEKQGSISYIYLADLIGLVSTPNEIDARIKYFTEEKKISIRNKNNQIYSLFRVLNEMKQLSSSPSKEAHRYDKSFAYDYQNDVFSPHQPLIPTTTSSHRVPQVKLTSARNSKLTTLLAPIIQGNALTTIFLFLRDGENFANETKNLLQLLNGITNISCACHRIKNVPLKSVRLKSTEYVLGPQYQAYANFHKRENSKKTMKIFESNSADSQPLVVESSHGDRLNILQLVEQEFSSVRTSSTLKSNTIPLSTHESFSASSTDLQPSSDDQYVENDRWKSTIRNTVNTPETAYIDYSLRKDGIQSGFTTTTHTPIMVTNKSKTKRTEDRSNQLSKMKSSSKWIGKIMDDFHDLMEELQNHDDTANIQSPLGKPKQIVREYLSSASTMKYFDPRNDLKVIQTDDRMHKFRNLPALSSGDNRSKYHQKSKDYNYRFNSHPMMDIHQEHDTPDDNSLNETKKRDFSKPVTHSVSDVDDTTSPSKFDYKDEHAVERLPIAGSHDDPDTYDAVDNDDQYSTESLLKNVFEYETNDLLLKSSTYSKRYENKSQSLSRSTSQSSYKAFADEKQGYSSPNYSELFHKEFAAVFSDHEYSPRLVESYGNSADPSDSPSEDQRFYSIKVADLPAERSVVEDYELLTPAVKETAASPLLNIPSDLSRDAFQEEKSIHYELKDEELNPTVFDALKYNPRISDIAPRFGGSIMSNDKDLDKEEDPTFDNTRKGITNDESLDKEQSLPNYYEQREEKLRSGYSLNVNNPSEIEQLQRTNAVLLDALREEKAVRESMKKSLAHWKNDVMEIKIQCDIEIDKYKQQILSLENQIKTLCDNNSLSAIYNSFDDEYHRLKRENEALRSINFQLETSQSMNILKLLDEKDHPCKESVPVTQIQVTDNPPDVLDRNIMHVNMTIMKKEIQRLCNNLKKSGKEREKYKQLYEELKNKERNFLLNEKIKLDTTRRYRITIQELNKLKKEIEKEKNSYLSSERDLYLIKSDTQRLVVSEDNLKKENQDILNEVSLLKNRIKDLEAERIRMEKINKFIGKHVGMGYMIKETDQLKPRKGGPSKIQSILNNDNSLERSENQELIWMEDEKVFLNPLLNTAMYDMHNQLIEQCPALLPTFRKLNAELLHERSLFVKKFRLESLDATTVQPLPSAQIVRSSNKSFKSEPIFDYNDIINKSNNNLMLSYNQLSSKYDSSYQKHYEQDRYRRNNIR